MAFSKPIKLCDFLTYELTKGLPIPFFHVSPPYSGVSFFLYPEKIFILMGMENIILAVYCTYIVSKTQKSFV